MIYFITNRPHDFNNDARVHITNDFSLVTNYLDSVKSFAFDKEFNGLNPILAIPLLTQVGDETIQFVIDSISYPDDSWLNPYVTHEMIGQNIKIDLSVATVNGFNLQPAKMKIWDTMIAEQRLGLDSGRGNDLESIYARRCGKTLNKTSRERFTEMDKNAIFEIQDVIYAAMDVQILPEIKRVQERWIKQWELEFLLQGIEFPVVPILVQMELEGLNINEEAWLKIIEDNKKALIQKELELDELLRKIGFAQPLRRKEEVIQLGMFGDTDTSKINPSKKNISYTAPKQILSIFTKLGEPKPNETKKIVNAKTKIKTYEDKDTVGEGAILTYIIEHPKSKMIPFLEKLIEHKEVAKELSSFGQRFLKSVMVTKAGKKQLGYKRKSTGRVHTVYRQCMTKTGRLSSGEADWGMYNSQQIPAIKKYRTAFTLSQAEIDDDWWITTSDLAGAETIIMCAFACDKQLYKWAVEDDDLHSPMATLCWKAVYNYRKSKADLSWATGELGQVDPSIFRIKDSKGISHTLTRDFKITKDKEATNAQMRTDFKSVTFGVIYGAEAKTIAKVLNISRAEAQIIINTIRLAIPDTFAMVMAASDEALANANLLFNTRTKSRKWFMNVYNKGTANMDNTEISNASSEARNAKIQGTQADMVKEAMVEVYRIFEAKGIQHCPLLQVHDELVWKHKGKEHGQLIPMIMGEVATRYLEGFTEMKAEAKTERTWIK